jgi:hypothetical protein
MARGERFLQEFGADFGRDGPLQPGARLTVRRLVLGADGLDNVRAWVIVEDEAGDEVLAFDGAFGIDSLADFIVCVACLDGWEDRQPLAWLGHYQAEDAKLLSREEALALRQPQLAALSAVTDAKLLSREEELALLDALTPRCPPPGP